MFAYDNGKLYNLKKKLFKKINKSTIEAPLFLYKRVK